jgi:hypothetical protein
MGFSEYKIASHCAGLILNLGENLQFSAFSALNILYGRGLGSNNADVLQPNGKICAIRFNCKLFHYDTWLHWLHVWGGAGDPLNNMIASIPY